MSQEIKEQVRADVRRFMEQQGRAPCWQWCVLKVTQHLECIAKRLCT